MLLDHGANVESDDGWALQTAATEGHIDIVKELLSRGGKVNQKTNHANFPQQTALQGACELGRGEIVDILLDHGADPNLGGGEDNYPIITAARNIQVEIIGKLISAHADVNVVGGDDGDTALIIVAKKIASLEPLKQLLEAGAAIDATNNNGDTALISAASSGDDEFVSFLLAKGADVLHTNNQGINAMQAASENDNPGDTLNILIKYVSTILSGINSRVQAGDQAVIDVVNEAKAMAQKANKTDHEIDTNEPSTENDQELYEDQEGHFNPEEVSIEVKADEITEQLVPIDQTFLSQSAAGSVAEVCHKVETSFMPQQDQTHNDYYTRPSNNDTYLCSNAAQQQTSINKADQFSNHGWVQQRETLYQQEQTVDSNHSLPGQHIIYQGVEAGQTHDVMPERNQVTPVRRKPAPIAYNTPHHSQTLAYAEPPSDQQSNTLYHQSSTFVAYDPRNNQSRPHSPPQNYPSQANAQNLYQPAYYDPGYPAAPQYSFPQESSHYESRPQPMHAYSSPTPLHQQQQPVRLSNANHATTPPPQNSRSSFFGVKNTLGQARGRLFSSNRREDSGR